MQPARHLPFVKIASTLSLLLLTTLSFALTAPPASAATLTVTSTADDGSSGTLRAEIAAANPGDTIVITATGTLDLQNSAPLTISKSLAIQGPGASNFTVNAAYDSQVFVINNSQSTVSLSGLTIENGSAPDAGTASAIVGGGGIYNDASLTVTNCTITGNDCEPSYTDATGENCYGAGIYSDGSLNLTNCTLTDNYAYAGEGTSGSVSGNAYGGAVYCTSTLSMTGCTVNTNWASGGVNGGPNSVSGNAYAAGVFAGGQTTITGCTISSNFSSGGENHTNAGSGASDIGVGYPGNSYGAAVATDSTVTMTGCSLDSNQSTGGQVDDDDSDNHDSVGYAGIGYGGAIYAENATVAMNACEMSGNEANAGDVVENEGSNDFAEYEDGTAYGGAIDGDSFILTNCVIAINYAFSKGAAVEADAPTLINCTVTGNHADTYSGGVYGGVDCDSCTLINDILWDNIDSNSSSSSATGENLNVANPGSSSISYSDVPAGTTSGAAFAGTGNIAADPLFVQDVNTQTYQSTGDLHLQLSSPSLGKGTQNGAPTTTIDGLTRPSPPSMGAYEKALPALKSVTLSPNSVQGASTPTTANRVYLTANAVETTVVTLTSSNTSVATVPASVTIQTGYSSHVFTIATKKVSATQTVTITATYRGITQTATLTVTQPPAALKSVTLSPSSANGGSASTTANRVYLTDDALSNAVVSLKSSNTAVATVPSSVTVQSGYSSHTFTIATKAVTSTQTVTITASYNGVTQSATLTVTPAPPGLASVTLSPSTVTGNMTTTANTVSLSGIAPVDTVVDFSESDPYYVSVQQSVTIKADTSSANFTITTYYAPEYTRTSTVTATSGGITQTATLTETPS